MANEYLNGRFSILRTFSNHEDPTPIHIDLIDEVSGCEVAEIRFSLEAFALAVTGQGNCKCQFQLRPASCGKVRELKHEIIEMPKNYDYKRRREVAAKAVKPFEVDGWECHSLDDCHNMHRSLGDNKFRVGFIRFVGVTRSNQDAPTLPSV